MRKNIYFFVDIETVRRRRGICREMTGSDTYKLRGVVMKVQMCSFGAIYLSLVR